MLTVNLFDNIFSHSVTSANIPPIRLQWIRDQMEWAGTTIFTDYFVNSPIVEQVKSKRKLLWLLESKEITAEAYALAEKNAHRFDLVLSHDRFLLEKAPEKFKFGLPASQRELQRDGIPTAVFPKTKMVSTIVSPKRQTIGHRFRHDIVQNLGKGMDVFGWNYRSIPNVIDGLRDYRFSVTVENSYYDYYFTEKLLNCFFTGTIPIYWGCPSIGNFFDPNGIITFQHLGDLHSILTNLNESDYEARLPAVRKNYDLAKNYLSAEEWLFQNVHDLLV